MKAIPCMQHLVLLSPVEAEEEEPKPHTLSLQQRASTSLGVLMKIQCQPKDILRKFIDITSEPFQTSKHAHTPAYIWKRPDLPERCFRYPLHV